MAKCEVCGNDYDKSFEVIMDDKSHIFDCMECAIHALAVTCDNCGIRILGHGVEAGNNFFCGAHCAEQAGVSEAKDRI